jgi:hypothetical protein
MAINDSSGETPADAKKPYEKPSFRYEDVFVTSALSCTKAPHELTCKLGPKKVS